MNSVKGLRVGDKVKIVDEWNRNSGENSSGEMDHWLGQIMTVREVGVREVRMVEDEHEYAGYGWHWYPGAIERKVSSDLVFDIEDGDLDALFE